MRAVAIAKFTDLQHNECFKLVTDNGIVQYDLETLRKMMRAERIYVQNLGEIRDKRSAIGQLTVDFIVGHDYPVFSLSNNTVGTHNLQKLTLIGFANTHNGKMFIVSDKDGVMFYVSNIEVKALEEFDLITNASYCSNGVVKLDGGKMEEVSPAVNNFAKKHDVNFVKDYINKLLESEIRRRQHGPMREPDFSKLDQLEKTLPNQLERNAAYQNMSNAYGVYGGSGNFKDTMTTVGIFGLGALSFVLDSVAFAGKMRLGNAILDNIFGER